MWKDLKTFMRGRLGCLSSDMPPGPDSQTTPSIINTTAEENLQRHSSDLTAKLPAEILATIFWFCLPAAMSPPSPLQAPLLLCTVNRFWKEVALSTSCLWTTIHTWTAPDGCATDLTRHEHLEVAYDALIARWIDNSKNGPLTINVLRAGRPVAAVGGVANSLGRIAAVSDQWQELNVNFHDNLAAVLVELLKDRATPQVKDAHVKVSWTTYSLPDIFLLFSKLPQLRRLRFESSIVTSLEGIPWGQLTHVSLKLITYKLWHHLSKCQSAVEVVVESTMPMEDLICDLDLPNLVFFHFESRFYMKTGDILKCLHAPCLRHLSVLIWDGEDLDSPEVQAFCERTGSLETIHAAVLFVTPQRVIKVIRQPFLQDIPNVCVVARFVHVMVPFFLAESLSIECDVDMPHNRCEWKEIYNSEFEACPVGRYPMHLIEDEWVHEGRSDDLVHLGWGQHHPHIGTSADTPRILEEIRRHTSYH